MTLEIPASVMMHEGSSSQNDERQSNKTYDSIHVSNPDVRVLVVEDVNAISSPEQPENVQTDIEKSQENDIENNDKLSEVIAPNEDECSQDMCENIQANEEITIDQEEDVTDKCEGAQVECENTPPKVEIVTTDQVDVPFVIEHVYLHPPGLLRQRHHYENNEVNAAEEQLPAIPPN